MERARTQAWDSAQRVIAVPPDVGDPRSGQALWAKPVGALVRLDVLFDSGGTAAPPVLMEDLACEQWKSVVDSNLTGTFLCTQQAIKIMKSQDPIG